MKLTDEILSENFRLSELENICTEFFDLNWYHLFVIKYDTDTRPMGTCLLEYLTNRLIKEVTVEELVENGFLSADVLNNNYDKVSHYYDSIDETYSIDAWKQGNDEGEVVAVINANTLSVTYLVEEAKGVQSIVDEIKKVMKKIVE